MIKRFKGEANRQNCLSALCCQRIIGHDRPLAEVIHDVAKLESFLPGRDLITQSHGNRDLLFLLAGSVAILVNGHQVGVRQAGTHVGKMALLDPAARRSATVRALEETVVARVSPSNFTDIAVGHPELWQRLAVELADRLRERGRTLVQPNAVPIVFIGSSRESLPVAEVVRDGFPQPQTRPVLWTNGIFRPGDVTIDTLISHARAADFAVLVFGPDDRVVSRGKAAKAPRDNVIFELGLFMGPLGREWTFVLKPAGRSIKVPTDLLGVTLLEFGLDDRIPLIDRLSSILAELVTEVARKGPK